MNPFRKLDERLGRIEAGLGEHMRRTEAAEKRLNLVEERQQVTLEKQAQWAGAGKLLSALATALAVGAALLKALA